MSPISNLFTLGREGSTDGSFQRQDSRFRSWVQDTPGTQVPLAPRRYHLYVARACPWAHRTLIGRALMGLEAAIGVSYLSPLRDDRGWAFDAEHPDTCNDFAFLAEAYEATDPGYADRVSVPVLWDSEREVIVNNESADILRMLETAFAPLAEHPVDLYPRALRSEIDALGDELYESVNNAVYRTGFATRQDVYDREVDGLFQALDRLDLRLADQRFLCGPAPVEADWRLFTTLVRFDAVYQVHFKCSIRKLVEYPNLWPYARDLYQWPGIAETVDFGEIRAHYYGTHPMINPSRIVAARPAASFETAPGREHLG